MTVSAETNTSANIKSPFLLLPLAFSAFIVPTSPSGDQLNLTAFNYETPVYSDNRESASSGEEFQFKNYLHEIIQVSDVDVLNNFIEKITKNSISLEPEMAEVINDNFWDLF